MLNIPSVSVFAAVLRDLGRVVVVGDVFVPVRERCGYSKILL